MEEKLCVLVSLDFIVVKFEKEDEEKCLSANDVSDDGFECDVSDLVDVIKNDWKISIHFTERFIFFVVVPAYFCVVVVLMKVGGKEVSFVL